MPAAAEDMERAREVYRACLKLLPHRAFTFGKVWIMAAQFEIRALRLDAARKILGMALGMCPKVSGWVGGWVEGVSVGRVNVDPEGLGGAAGAVLLRTLCCFAAAQWPTSCHPTNQRTQQQCNQHLQLTLSCLSCPVLPVL
jgi:hypothetical protein